MDIEQNSGFNSRQGRDRQTLAMACTGALLVASLQLVVLTRYEADESQAATTAASVSIGRAAVDRLPSVKAWTAASHAGLVAPGLPLHEDRSGD